MSFSGDLRGISLADVFQNIAGNQGTGTLRVRGRAGERFVRFEQGAVAGCAGEAGSKLPLLQHLVGRGWVDEAALKRLLARKKKSRKTGGRLIVEGGLLDAEQMAAALEELVAEHVYELMLEREAEFAFTEGDPPPRLFDPDLRAFPVRLTAGPLLMEGMRRRDEWERIHRVISSERDLFVLLTGWESCGVDEPALAIAEWLDGRTDVAAVIAGTRCSRFEVHKAICDLVLAGAARPCTAEEIVGSAREALAESDADSALRLMHKALEIGRSDRGLRKELAQLLEQLGRPQEAAAEYALLGYQAAQDGERDEALQHYQRAAELDAADPVLRERRIELLRDLDDVDALAAAVLELAGIWLYGGLAERARALLRQTVERDGLGARSDVMEKLGEVEALLGRLDEAAAIYAGLADAALPDDERAALDYLRRGLQQCPDAPALVTRLADVESGRRERRRRRRRRLVQAAAVGVGLLMLGSAGVAELTAAREVVGALSGGLDGLERGQASLTIEELRRVHDRLGWTPSGRQAGELVERLVQLQVDAARELAAHGQKERALGLLNELHDGSRRPPAAVRELRQQLQLELRAEAALNRVTQDDCSDADFDAAVQVLQDRRLVGMLTARLPELRHPRARMAALQALVALDDPRTAAAAARVFVTAADSKLSKLASQVLSRAAGWREAGHERDWAAVYPELEAALLDGQRGTRARQALDALRGDDTLK